MAKPSGKKFLHYWSFPYELSPANVVECHGFHPYSEKQIEEFKKLKKVILVPTETEDIEVPCDLVTFIALSDLKEKTVNALLSQAGGDIMNDDEYPKDDDKEGEGNGEPKQ